MSVEVEKVNIELQSQIDQIVAMAETHGYIDLDALRKIVEGSDV